MFISRICWYLMFMLIFSCVFPVTLMDTPRVREYCPLETFQPVCQSDEVVVMSHAVYGRIRIGRCIKQDVVLGCSVDILQIPDKLCSGRKTCEIVIPNSQMTSQLYCLKNHPSLLGSTSLEASYHCQKVYLPSESQCHSPVKLKATNEQQTISSEISKVTSCGYIKSPWILEAEPMQTIEINMVDFSWRNDTDDGACPVNYGYILDTDSDDVINICGGSHRNKLLYVSSSNRVQMVLESNALQQHRFLIGFKAIGCPKYVPPAHSWIQEENDSLVISCSFSDKSWKLKCLDNRWLGGIVGNCTTPPIIPASYSTTTETAHEIVKSDDPSVQMPNISNNHVLVFTIGCLTVLILCVVVILGVYHIKRYDVKLKKYKKPNYSTAASYQSGRLTLGSVPVTYRTMTQDNTSVPPAYTFSLPKARSAPKVPPRNTVGQKDMALDGNVLLDNNVYENVQEDSDSVKYYILENPEDINNPAKV